MFKVHSRNIADVEPFVFKAGTGLATGMAVTVNTSDAFVKATGTACPTHIIVGEKSKGVWGAIPVLPTTTFETTSTPAVTTVGVAVQIVAGGDSVNATTGGAFNVTYTENKSGGIVRGYFKEVK